MLYRARPCIKREEMKKIKFQPLLTLLPTLVILAKTPSNLEKQHQKLLSAMCYWDRGDPPEKLHLLVPEAPPNGLLIAVSYI